MRVAKSGLIQCANALDPEQPVARVRDAMMEKHLPFIEKAAKQGVKILCFQEVFDGPYFCPSQDPKWYELAESIPDGPTVKLMQELAKKHSMVLVVPMYEKAMTGGLGHR